MKDIITIAIGGLVALIVLWIAANFLWNKKYRPWKLKKGVPTPLFNNVLKRIINFLLKEDNEPISKKINSKLGSRKFIYILLIAGSVITLFIKQYIVAVALIVIVLLMIISRTRTVFSQRDAVLRRMFEVANSEFKYARGSELNPWSFVNIKSWETLYVPGETEVVFPAAFRSDDPRKRSDFENHFNGTLGENNTWIYEWDGPKGIVKCHPVSHLPTMAKYGGSEKEKWNMVPLGIGPDGPIYWDMAQYPHMLVCGTTGGGKSVMQRTVIFHCIQHSDEMRFLGVDLKRVELSAYKKYSDVILGIAVTLEDGVEVMRFGKEEMMNRYTEMEEMGVDHFSKLPNPPKVLVIMVDEAYMFMAPENVATDEGKARNELHGEATTIIGEIARLGRAAGIHLLLATQRPDAKVIYGEIKQNLSARYAAGRMNSTASTMVLDSDSATRTPGDIKGRAILSLNGEESILQGYFAEQSWIDEWLNGKGKTGADGISEDNDIRFLDDHSMPDLEDGEISIDPVSQDTFESVTTNSEFTIAEPQSQSTLSPIPLQKEFAVEDDEYETPFDTSDSAPIQEARPNLMSKPGAPDAVREEDFWDDDMESIFEHMDVNPSRQPVEDKPSTQRGLPKLPQRPGTS